MISCCLRCCWSPLLAIFTTPGNNFTEKYSFKVKNLDGSFLYGTFCIFKSTFLVSSSLTAGDPPCCRNLSVSALWSRVRTTLLFLTIGFVFSPILFKLTDTVRSAKYGIFLEKASSAPVCMTAATVFVRPLQLFVKQHQLFVRPLQMFVRPLQQFEKQLQLFEKQLQLFVRLLQLFVRPLQLF